MISLALKLVKNTFRYPISLNHSILIINPDKIEIITTITNTAISILTHNFLILITPFVILYYKIQGIQPLNSLNAIILLSMEPIHHPCPFNIYATEVNFVSNYLPFVVNLSVKYNFYPCFFTQIFKFIAIHPKICI